MKIAVLGAGLMGRAIAWDLLGSEGVEKVLLIDSDKDRLVSGAAFADDVETKVFDVADSKMLIKTLQGYDAAVSCVPYRFNEGITAACIEAGAHMCDLGGNNDTVDAQFRLSNRAKEQGVTVIPDCGLAPGMASTWAMAGVEALDECESVHIRVGGLPADPVPPLNYMKLFSMTGLINEYIEPCRVISEGQLAIVEGLSGLEKLSFPPPFEELEAFYTSGGTSTLVATLMGRVRNLDYKTIRYPGHCSHFRVMAAIGLTDYGPIIVEGREVSPRKTLEALLDSYLPSTGVDVTLMRVDCTRVVEGKRKTVRHQMVDYADSATGLTSMMRCTGFPAAAVARMMADGTITDRGVIPQETVVPAERLAEELRERGVEIEQSVLQT